MTNASCEWSVLEVLDFSNDGACAAREGASAKERTSRDETAEGLNIRGTHLFSFLQKRQVTSISDPAQ